ncbi:sigma-70 family RNA polymerase sigma factor [Prolixibacteraceae bacterium Z1-6]|uniref:Sigma-70 family RNA polymerase sigma factor n=1 Tax=Draconibacterium aestuarii TaxID=2998507 RepID=A0A9X3F326_9BACT|nr:sigma-70 family RNA polymerase sigma factor [Prolixibacteraceae bacterium Z1-6]
MTNKESDLRIWQSFKGGNKAAFQKIYFEHYRFLYNYCRKFTNDTALVEDLIQDLFINILVRKDRLSDTDNIRLYLFRSVRRSLFKALNANQYKVTDLFDPVNPAFHFDESVDPNYGEDEDNNKTLKILFKSVNGLGERQKEMIYMKYFSGFNSKEIAEVLGVSYQTVRNTLCNALRNIRKDFEEDLPKGKMVVLFHFFKQISRY